MSRLESLDIIKILDDPAVKAKAVAAVEKFTKDVGLSATEDAIVTVMAARSIIGAAAIGKILCDSVGIDAKRRLVLLQAAMAMGLTVFQTWEGEMPNA